MSQLIKVLIEIDGVMTEVPYEDLSKYVFNECIVTERMTRQEFEKLYCNLDFINELKAEQEKGHKYV